MALTSGEYEAQSKPVALANGVRDQKLSTSCVQISSPRNLASGSRVARRGVSELSWRGALDFASTRHPGPTAIAGFGVSFTVALGGGSQAQQRGCPRR